MAQPSQGGADNLRPVRVLSVPASPPIAVRFLGSYLGMLVHWHAGQYRACLGERVCPPTRHRATTVWKGYAPAESWDNAATQWVPCVLEITEALEERFRGRKLRGEGWLLSRESKTDAQSPVIGMFAETYDAAKLRTAFDVKTVLLRVYHEADLVLGVENPIPPRLMLASEDGVAPNMLRELQKGDPADRQATPEEIKFFKQRMREMLGGRRAADGTGAEKGAPGTHGRNGSGGKV